MIDHTTLVNALIADAKVFRVRWLPDEYWAEARSFPKFAVVEAARPVDDTTLAIFAHECGHCATTVAVVARGGSDFDTERAATAWAYDAVKRHSGALPTPEMNAAWAEGLRSHLEN